MNEREKEGRYVFVPLVARAFLLQHIDECGRVNQLFSASGDDGYVLLRSEPGSEINDNLKIYNNYALHVSFTYNYKGES